MHRRLRRPWRLWLAALGVIAIFGAARTAQAGARCGPTTCGADEVCCNYGCGICTPRGGSCIMLACPWGRPDRIAPVGTPSVDAFERALAQVAFERATAGGEDTVGISAGGLLQSYFGDGVGLRIGLMGNRIVDPDLEVDESGFAVGLGGTFVLPDLVDKLVGWALVLDLEYGHGAALGGQLAPRPNDTSGLGTLGAGLAFADLRDVVPVHAHARWLEQKGKYAEGIGALDLGLGVSFDLARVVHRPSLAIRLDYRFVRDLVGDDLATHQGSGGLYWSFTDGLRIGLETTYSAFLLDGHQVAHELGLGLRLDYYTDVRR
jgi:hypothetical protein